MKLKKAPSYTIKIDDATFTGCTLTRPEVLQIFEDHTTKNHKGKEQVNEVEVAFTCFNRTVKGWSGIRDDDGSELPCDETNKRYLFDNHADLSKEIIAAFENAQAEHRREKEKN